LLEAKTAAKNCLHERDIFLAGCNRDRRDNSAGWGLHPSICFVIEEQSGKRAEAKLTLPVLRLFLL
jgi:hypothetical protein